MIDTDAQIYKAGGNKILSRVMAGRDLSIPSVGMSIWPFGVGPQIAYMNSKQHKRRGHQWTP